MKEEFNDVFNRIEAKFRAKRIPKLKTLFRGAVYNISNLTNLLVRKSLLKENLYSYSEDDRNSFFLPEEKAFLDNEKARVLYDRLKAHMNALENQASRLTDDIDAISERYVENTEKLLTYFAFNNYNSNSGLNTRTLKEMTDKIIAGKDQILRKIVLDNLKLLSENYTRIKEIIDEFLNYKKEKYKFLIRLMVFPALSEGFSEKLLQENPSQYLTRLSKIMSANFPDISFNKFWIVEAIKSCYTTKPEDELRRLQSIFLADMIKRNETGSISSTPRGKLIYIIDQLSSSSDILEKIYINIEQNLKILFNRKRNIFEEFFFAFKKAISSNNKDEFFQLEYINPANKTLENDTININEFLLSIKKKIVLFRSILKDGSNANEKIKRGTESALYKFLEESYFDMLLTKERIIGINVELRLKIPKKDRIRIKDMKEPLERLDELLRKIGELRRKYVTEQDRVFTRNKK